MVTRAATQGRYRRHATALCLAPPRDARDLGRSEVWPRGRRSDRDRRDPQAGSIHVAVQGHPAWRDRADGAESLDSFCRAAVATGSSVATKCSRRSAATCACARRRANRVACCSRLIESACAIRLSERAGQPDLRRELRRGRGTSALSPYDRAPGAVRLRVLPHGPGPQTIYREHTRLMPSECRFLRTGG